MHYTFLATFGGFAVVFWGLLYCLARHEASLRRDKRKRLAAKRFPGASSPAAAADLRAQVLVHWILRQRSSQPADRAMVAAAEELVQRAMDHYHVEGPLNPVESESAGFGLKEIQRILRTRPHGQA